MIKFNEKFTVSVDATDVDESGQRYIRQLLTEVSVHTLPGDWRWSRCIQGGELRGKLPKRIAIYYKKTHGENLSSDVQTGIGNRVDRYSFSAKTYTLDFTTKFDWHAGDFGDYGSCFWGCRKPARDALVENDVIAVRFYRTDGCGYARAFVIRLAGGLIIFNAYGLECRVIAYVLATLFEYPHRRSIDLCIRGDPDGLIWLNEDTHQIGHESLAGEVTVDFDVPYAMCKCCDRFYPVEQGEYDDYDGFRCLDCSEA